MKRYIPIILSFLFPLLVNAQMGGGSWGGGAAKSRMNSGHFYGKVVDSATGTSIPFAAVQLTGPKWDSASQSMKTAVVAGQLTGDNGEFSLDKLPVAGPFFQPVKYTLQISAMGYKVYETTVSFDLTKLMQQAKKARAAQGGDNSNPMAAVEGMIDVVDKDLGNIKLVSNATQLNSVTVNGEAPPMELKLDKRVFDVSKSITNTGGTAEDVLKVIPAVNVDIDGNVTLRNASPQIYVDGMPSTLTIDQIPADEIDKVEVITNPSAKYDAAAGSGGIINIILKHNKSVGYNGSVRAGIDERGKPTGGLDLNLRQGKVNIFADVFTKQIEHKMYGSETKDTIDGSYASDPLDITQHDTNTMNGYFVFARAGLDYFIDNRNTLTVSGMYGTGHFTSLDLLHTATDTVSPFAFLGSSTTSENSDFTRNFQHSGATVSFKHLYPKDGKNITASISANQGQMIGSGTYTIQNFNENNSLLSQVNEEQSSDGKNGYYVGQADYTNPVTKKSKIESGVMVTINDVSNISNMYINNDFVSHESNSSEYDQQIYAAYFTFSHDFSARLSGQLGIRLEQSLYSGQVTTDTVLKLSPQSLLYPFPSANFTYHLTDKSDLQLSYTSHIVRPNFMQLVVNNYSNSENVQIGNPNLKPAYMSSFELNYLNNFSKRNNILVSVYYKQTENIISSQLDSSEYSPLLGQNQYFSTYENANYAYSEGFEFTSQNSIGDWLDATANINLFQSGINATNLNIPDTAKNFLSYFAKLNLTFKLPKSFSIQLNGNYLSKAKVPPEGSGGGRWGGGGFGGGITPSASGYILANYWMDAAIKKDFLKNNKASLTFSIRDVFATAVHGTTYLATDPAGKPLYYETTSRIRDPRYFQLTFSYRFGQTDFTLFKRKNTNIDMSAPDMSGGDAQ